MSIEAMKQALEALEQVTKELLAVRDELAERGARPTTNVFHQRLWDSSFSAYTDHAIPAATSLRQALSEAQLSVNENSHSIEQASSVSSIQSDKTSDADKQEPVAMQMDVIVVNLVREGINKHRARELAEHFIKHTTPQPQREWVGLTDEEVDYIADEYSTLQGAIRAIEAKLKEKNK